MNVPPFEIPTSFVPFIDHEHSMLFCYPTEWRHQPLTLQIQGVVSENPLNLRPGDVFAGTFNVVVSSPGQQTYSLKEIVLMAKYINLSLKKVTKELGVKISPKTESLQIPLERVLSLIGAKGQNRTDQIYEINYQTIERLSDKPVRRDTEVVDGRESLLIEREVEQNGIEALVQFMVITYIPEVDLIFTFTFTDNVRGSSKIDKVRKQILNAVKFWETASRSASSTSAA